MLKVDARGDACPLPVVKAKKAISELKGAGEVEVLVDNEIAVQNLTKMAQQKGYQYSAEKLAEQEYRVLFTVGNAAAAPAEEVPVCAPDTRTDTVVAISSDKMGIGADDLGKALLKAFVFALTQQDKLPKTIRSRPFRCANSETRARSVPLPVTLEAPVTTTAFVLGWISPCQLSYCRRPFSSTPAKLSCTSS